LNLEYPQVTGSPFWLSAELLEGGGFGHVDLNSWSEIGQVMVDLDIGTSGTTAWPVYKVGIVGAA